MIGERAFKLDMVSVRLVKDAPILSGVRIISPESAVEAMGSVMSEIDREVVAVINLKADGTPINASFVSMGTINAALTEPRELLKASILSNAANVIMVHNHPSGRLEARKRLAVVVRRVELRVLVDVAAEEAAVDRAVRDESDAQLAADVQDAVLLHEAVHKVVFALDRRERTDRVGAADDVRRHFAEPPPLHLPLADEIGDAPGHVLDGRVAVEAMLVEKRDGVEAQAAQGFLAVAAHDVRAARLASRRLAVHDLVPELRRDVDPSFVRREGLAHKQFVFERTVHDGRVEQRHAAVHGPGQKPRHLLLVGMLRTVVREAHAAESERRDGHRRASRAENPTRKRPRRPAARTTVARRRACRLRPRTERRHPRDKPYALDEFFSVHPCSLFTVKSLRLDVAHALDVLVRAVAVDDDVRKRFLHFGKFVGREGHVRRAEVFLDARV